MSRIFWVGCFPLRPGDFNPVGVLQGFLEIVNGLKVVAAIGLGLAHKSSIHQIEDYVAEVLGGLYSPGIEDGTGKIAEPLPGAIADAKTEFLTRNMPALANFFYRIA